MAHVVGGLSLDQGRVFRSHLLECPSCRARVGELRAIAHDLADVERDERRIRLAKRTETKTTEATEEPVAAPSRWNGRATLLMAAGLVVLMTLSAWNFVLRGRLQQTDEIMSLMRQSVGVLKDGQSWSPVSTSTPGVDGQVSTLGQDMVVTVNGLVERSYGLYLLNADGATVHRVDVHATNGMLYEYVVDRAAVKSADRVLVVRTDDLTEKPSGTTVFDAQRGGDRVDLETPPVVETGP